MSGHFEPTVGTSDEWYTPRYIFNALGETFDLDVASPDRDTHVPAAQRYTEGSLERAWRGFVWMNPPFGGRNGLVPWLDKFFEHGCGIALTPDRTSAPWWQDAAQQCSSLLFLRGKVRFERPDGSIGKSPANGTTLFAVGPRADAALVHAAPELGWIATPSIRRIAHGGNTDAAHVHRHSPDWYRVAQIGRAS